MPEGEISQKVPVANQATEATVVEKMVEALTLYGMKIIAAVVIIVVGLWISKIIKNCFVKTLQKKEVDPTLVGFFASMVHGSLVIFVVISAISKLGVHYILRCCDWCGWFGSWARTARFTFELCSRYFAYSLQTI